MDAGLMDCCVCTDCTNIREQYDGVQSLLKAYSGYPGAGQPLSVARKCIMQAWIAMQGRHRHEFMCGCRHDYQSATESSEEEQALFEEDDSDGGVQRLCGDRSLSAGSEDSDGEKSVSDTDHDDNDGSTHMRGNRFRSLTELIMSMPVPPHDPNDHNIECLESPAGFNGRQIKTYEKGTDDPDHQTNGGTHNKYMVCDHCRVHALPCNEASVCDQCELHEQPCVHRWCRKSRYSKADCPHNNCRYAHEDSVTDREREPRWVILEGKLPEYRSKGRVPARAFGAEHRSIDNAQRLAELDRRQDRVLEHEGPFDKLAFPCDCHFETGEAVPKIRVEPTTSQLEPLIVSGDLPKHQHVEPEDGTLLIVAEQEECTIKKATHLQRDEPALPVSNKSSFIPPPPSRTRIKILDANGQPPNFAALSRALEESGPELGDRVVHSQPSDSTDEVEDLRDTDSKRPTCVKCGEDSEYYSVPPCHHLMCYGCAIVQRDNSRKVSRCLACPGRDRVPHVVFTDDAQKRFVEYNDSEDFEVVDDKLGIRFETARIRQDTMWFLDAHRDVQSVLRSRRLRSG